MNDAGFLLFHWEMNGLMEKPVSLEKRVLEIGLIKKILLTAYKRSSIGITHKDF